MIKFSLIFFFFTIISSCRAQSTSEPNFIGDLYPTEEGVSQSKKYFFGFHQKLSGFMGNETFYDLKHVSEALTSDQTNGYETHLLTRDDSESIDERIQSGWDSIGEKITDQDVYVQYSSSHGFPGGLAFNAATYGNMRNQIRKFNAKITFIMTMACYSGSMIEEFNRNSGFDDWKAAGKTLLLFTSSKASETSSTGPMEDPDESGPEGSAGSAFGHYLWKGLAGGADGAYDGFKDGLVELDELIYFATRETREAFGHTPQYYGFNFEGVVVSRK